MSKVVRGLRLIVKLVLVARCVSTLATEQLQPSLPKLETTSPSSLQIQRRPTVPVDLEDALYFWYEYTRPLHQLPYDKQSSEEVADSLKKALDMNNYPEVKRLLKGGAQGDTLDSLGRTALMHAVLVNDKELLDQALYAGADPNLVDNEGRTALRYALMLGNVPFFKRLVKISDVNLKDAYGISLAMSAAQKQKLLLLSYLLKKGATIDDKDRQGNTALHYAIATNNAPIVKLLLDNGADLSIKNSNGENPYQLARRLGLPSIITALDSGAARKVQEKQRETFLRLLASQDHPAIKTFVRYVQSINGQDELGKTYLMYATEARNYMFVEELIIAGADPRITDKSGKNSLDYAQHDEKLSANLKVARLALETNTNTLNTQLAKAIYENADPGVIKELIRRGAQVNVKPEGLDRPLYYALYRQNVPLTRLLLDAGADPFIPLDQAGHVRPLAYIAAHDNDNGALAEALIQAGVDINAQDAEGRTPLNLATEKGHVAVARALLKANADPNIPNRGGYTPLIFALYMHPALVEDLLKAGADPLFKIEEEGSMRTIYEFANRDLDESLISLLDQYVCSQDSRLIRLSS